MPLFLCEVTEADNKPYVIPVHAENFSAAANVVCEEVELEEGAGSCQVLIRELSFDDSMNTVGKTERKKAYAIEWADALGKVIKLNDQHRTPSDLSREELATVLEGIIGAMYHEGPDTEWDAGTIAEVATVLGTRRLIPSK